MGRNVLLVSYLFPPSGGVGVQRALAFARYLPANDCKVTVVTAGNASTALRDESLLSLVPREVQVFPTFTPELPFELRSKIWSRIAPAAKPGAASSAKTAPLKKSLLGTLKAAAGTAVKRLLSPDPQIGWVPFATRKASELIKAQRIDTVLVTVPPFSALNIAVKLKREFPHVKTIIDFRDEWLGYYMSMDTNADSYKRKVAIQLERDAVLYSDHVVSVTPPWVQQIRNRHPDQPAGKFICIPNGYDPEMFADFKPRPHGQQKIVITYMGTIYNNPVHSPRVFLDALDGLPEAVRSTFEIWFIGRVMDEEVARMEACRCSIRRLGFMPQKDAFKKLEETDYLLMLNSDPNAHTGKLFEYIAANKPIVALSREDGEIARVLRETGTGWSVNATDVSRIQGLLMTLFEAWSRGEAAAPKRQEAEIRSYSRPELVRKFVEATGMATPSKQEAAV